MSGLKKAGYMLIISYVIFFLQKNPVNYIFVENVTEEIFATGNRVHMPVLSFT